MKPRISAIIIAYNEEKNITDCLRSVSFADEIIVVDNESTDKTAVIAKKFTKYVFTSKRAGYVEPVRNFALTKATGEWVIFLDADERIPETLAATLREISDGDEYDAVLIPRKNIIFNKWIEHTGWWPDTILRFFKSGVIIWPEEIHRQPLLPKRLLTLPADEHNSIVHYNYASISQYLQKLDRYTTIQAKEEMQRGHKFHIAHIISDPTHEFISRFFAYEGYKDGLHGLALSLLQAFSSLITTLKLWELQGFPEDENVLESIETEGKKAGKEITYWMTTTKILIQKNPIKRLYLQGKRKASR